MTRRVWQLIFALLLLNGAPVHFRGFFMHEDDPAAGGAVPHEREELFKKVWDTNYTGDTRTLDVHISWLRRAIEIDADHPRFLHTVRGVGYQLL